MALTEAQRADMQADLGISDDQAVFTNDELDRLYERAGGNYDRAVYYGLRQLLANAAKFHDYTAGQTRQQRSQAFGHLKVLVDLWAAKVAGAQQVRTLGILQVPPREKDKPSA